MGLGHLASMKCAHHVYPSFGIADLRRLTVLFKFASPGAKRVLSVTPLWQLAGEIVNKRGQGKHAPARNTCLSKSFDFRRYRLVARCHRPTPGRSRVAKSTPVPSCLVHPDGLLGLTRRETNPASAEVSRASFRTAAGCGRYSEASAPPRAYSSRLRTPSCESKLRTEI